MNIARRFNWPSGRTLRILLLLLLALLANPITSVMAAEVVRAGVLNHFPPHYMTDQQSGQAKGFSIEVMDEVVAEAGMTVNYVSFRSWGEVWAAFNAGEVDIIPDTGLVEERSDWALYTSPTESFPITLFTRRSTTDIQGIRQLAGKKVSVVKLNVGLSIMQDFGEATLRVHETPHEALLELLSGNSDALVYPGSVMRWLAREAGLEDRIQGVGVPLREVKRGIAVRHDLPQLYARLEKAVHNVITSPRYRDIYGRWHGKQPGFWSAPTVAATMGSMLIISVLGLAYWRFHTKRAAEQTLRLSEARFRDFAETAADWFWETGPDLRFTFQSSHFLDAEGISPMHLLKEGLLDRREDHVASEVWESLLDDLKAHRPFEGFELQTLDPADNRSRILRLSGKPIVDSLGQFNGYRGCGSDITEAYHLSYQLSHQASHDFLTSLENRHAFEQRLSTLIASPWQLGTEHALCYLDLDQFKVVNDTCGHIAGDELLRQLGRLLKENVRNIDTVARMGGDEFGILMESCSIENALRVLENLRQIIESFGFVWEGKTFSTSVSAGLVPFTSEISSYTELLRTADTACYAAKDAGRNRIHVYHHDDLELERRHGEMQWVSRITQALDEERFELHVQTIVPAEEHPKGHGLHYEVLIRMRDEEGNLIEPGAFLPAAERYGLSPRLDYWVVGTALAWLNSHREHLQKLELCSINLSGPTLCDSGFMAFAIEQLEQCQIPPEKICFEITETAAIANLTAAISFITRMRTLGCRFALDDFGSGLSSFAYLKSLPVDILKIDGVFVKDIVDDPMDLAFVRSINDLGHVMGKVTVAEFVENNAIKARLREIGVDYLQGYGIGRPQHIDSLLRQAGPSNVRSIHGSQSEG